MREYKRIFGASKSDPFMLASISVAFQAALDVGGVLVMRNSSAHLAPSTHRSPECLSFHQCSPKDREGFYYIFGIEA